jgi:hypothetical protein
MKLQLCMVCLVFMLISCAKEEQMEPEDSDPDGAGLLEKVRLGTAHTNYQYDVNNRVVRMSTIEGNGTDSSYIKFIRNASGDLVRLVEWWDVNDSAVTVVAYKAGTTEISNYVHTSHNLTDSNVVTYTGGLVTLDHYVWDSNLQQNKLVARTSYDFQNGDLKTLKQYHMGLNLPNRQLDFTYDTKVPPVLYSVNDVIVAQMELAYISHNVLTESVSYPMNNSTPYTRTYTHTYNSTQRPAVAKITDSRNNITLQYEFYYRL